MKRYLARVVREGNWWVVTVDRVGVTQARHLADVEAQAAGLIEAMTGRAGAAVDIRIDLPPDLASQIDEARRLTEAAAQAQLDAANRTRVAVRELLAVGLPQVDVATIFGVSRQRVSQLAADRSLRDPTQAA